MCQSLRVVPITHGGTLDQLHIYASDCLGSYVNVSHGIHCRNSIFCYRTEIQLLDY